MTASPIALPPHWWNSWANRITVGRLLLCFVVVALVVAASPKALAWAFWLTIAVIWMDGLDGYVARKRGESSVLGGVLDILSDRIVEQVYWVTFAVLCWVPLWVPLVVITRGVLVDGVRSVALQHGMAAFGVDSMMKSPLGVFLVSSRFSRASYAVLKAAAFAFVIGAQWVLVSQAQWFGLSSLNTWSWVQSVANACVWGAVFFCVVRGLPVLFQLNEFTQQPSSSSSPP
ncbi:MAG: CDP-alcohol phosphatidyltransferase family protein [Vampirovibrionales bacterium]|nr:CDP-alcohol phosphatidyltransferase family protein [Vampirovibrionales bacterium]